jgi:hypothetical protein
MITNRHWQGLVFRLDSPDKAGVLCVDEQPNPRPRTHPTPAAHGDQLHRVTYDRRRHGTTTLFAALNALDGAVIAQTLRCDFILYVPPSARSQGRYAGFTVELKELTRN